MSDKIYIPIKIDRIIKEKAEPILNDSNSTLSEAAELFFTQIVEQKGLPFDLRSVQFRHLANEEVYEIIQVFHNEMLFTPSRIKRSSLPDNVYLYEVQYDDDNIGNPEIIKEHVICNFFGSLLSRQRLKMLENDCILINENSNWTYSGITGITLSEWISG